ncbi:MAG: GTPase HflX, partial [Pseudomonadota bacterium]
TSMRSQPLCLVSPYTSWTARETKTRRADLRCHAFGRLFWPSSFVPDRLAGVGSADWGGGKSIDPTPRPPKRNAPDTDHNKLHGESSVESDGEASGPTATCQKAERAAASDGLDQHTAQQGDVGPRTANQADASHADASQADVDRPRADQPAVSRFDGGSNRPVITDIAVQSLTQRKITETDTGAPTIVLVPVLSLAQARSATAPAARHRRAGTVDHPPEAKLQEAVGLAQAIGLNVVRALIVPVPHPKAGTLFGTGKRDALADMVADLGIELVIVDHAVTPVQQRNLETAWQAKVMDRTGLILEIFGARARTKEGRLQVELAHLSYQRGRLVRAWTHLERQRGGAGFLGGPGEAQIELDRRMLQSRIDALKRELAQVVRTRELHRAGRRKVPYPVVALVGYTNAGKSTLFNALTGAGVLAEDQVFATLDPTLREVRLSSGRRIMLSDTVGFISELPTSLVAAFKATLEEVIEADVIVHVRDLSHAHTTAQASDVHAILKDLGVSRSSGQQTFLDVWNKADCLTPDERRDCEISEPNDHSDVKRIWISAATGEGLDGLLELIDGALSNNDVTLEIDIPAADGRLYHWVHANADVLEKVTRDDGGHTVQLRLSREKHGQLMEIMQGT